MEASTSAVPIREVIHRGDEYGDNTMTIHGSFQSFSSSQSSITMYSNYSNAPFQYPSQETAESSPIRTSKPNLMLRVSQKNSTARLAAASTNAGGEGTDDNSSTEEAAAHLLSTSAPPAFQLLSSSRDRHSSNDFVPRIPRRSWKASPTEAALCQALDLQAELQLDDDDDSTSNRDQPLKAATVSPPTISPSSIAKLFSKSRKTSSDHAASRGLLETIVSPISTTTPTDQVVLPPIIPSLPMELSRWSSNGGSPTENSSSCLRQLPKMMQPLPKPSKIRQESEGSSTQGPEQDKNEENHEEGEPPVAPIKIEMSLIDDDDDDDDDDLLVSSIKSPMENPTKRHRRVSDLPPTPRHRFLSPKESKGRKTLHLRGSSNGYSHKNMRKALGDDDGAASQFPPILPSRCHKSPFSERQTLNHQTLVWAKESESSSVDDNDHDNDPILAADSEFLDDDDEENACPPPPALAHSSTLAPEHYQALANPHRRKPPRRHRSDHEMDIMRMASIVETSDDEEDEQSRGGGAASSSRGLTRSISCPPLTKYKISPTSRKVTAS
jgi:hypothetical protein